MEYPLVIGRGGRKDSERDNPYVRTHRSILDQEGACHTKTAKNEPSGALHRVERVRATARPMGIPTGGSVSVRARAYGKNGRIHCVSHLWVIVLHSFNQGVHAGDASYSRIPLNGTKRAFQTPHRKGAIPTIPSRCLVEKRGLVGRSSRSRNSNPSFKSPFHALANHQLHVLLFSINGLGCIQRSKCLDFRSRMRSKRTLQMGSSLNARYEGSSRRFLHHRAAPASCFAHVLPCCWFRASVVAPRCSMIESVARGWSSSLVATRPCT